MSDKLDPCPWCGVVPSTTLYDVLFIFKCEVCGYSRSFPGYLQEKESPVVASGPGSAVKLYYHADALKEAIGKWNRRFES